MPQYVFSLTQIFPFKDIIFDSVLIGENADQKKPVLLHILRSEHK